jgi:hypothetical protein
VAFNLPVSSGPGHPSLLASVCNRDDHDHDDASAVPPVAGPRPFKFDESGELQVEVPIMIMMPPVTQRPEQSE